MMLFGVILVFAFSSNNLAFGAFDKYGNYYCNPANMVLEKTIYRAAVNTFNDAIDSYLSLNPDPTYQQLRDYIIHSSSGTAESTYDIMNKAQACLVSNGINPLLIASPISLVSKMGFAPEFGNLARLVVLFSVIGVIVITRRFFMKDQSSTSR